MTKSRFRTIAISNPKYEADGIRTITVKSDNLKGRGDISVYVPEGEKLEDLPMVLLLHGVYGSHWSWLHFAGIHLKMTKWIASGELKPMVLVMPSDGLWGDGSGYIPHSNMNFEKWIVEDVIDAVLESIPQVSKTSSVFITGLSMGGYGALRLGAKYGDLFKGFSGLSSITHLNEMKQFIEEDTSVLRQKDKDEASVLKMILANKNRLAPFCFDCGLEDDLLSANRELHEALEKNNIPHTYKEHKGEHNWEYWEVHILDTLLFFNQLT